MADHLLAGRRMIRVFMALMTGSASSVGSGDEQNGEHVENKHKSQECLGFAVGTGKFFPGENSPEGGDHGGGLADGIGNGDAGKISGDQVEYGTGGPDGAAQQTQQVAAGWAAKQAAEGDGFADQRF